MALRRRHRDLWMTYVAQSIVGPKPKHLPRLAEVPGVTNVTDAKLAREIDRIKNVLQEHLPCPAEHIMKLCIEGERYSYELVTYADRDMMERGEVSNEERLASIVSERMLKIYSKMFEEQSLLLRSLSLDLKTPQFFPGTSPDDVQKTLFSLRRVISRFCNHSGYLPPSLFLQELFVPPGLKAYGGGTYGDIYRLDNVSGRLTLKCFRIFEQSRTAKSDATQILTAEAIRLSHLKHPNLAQFIGLHQQTIEEFRFTYIVTPWMENGNIMSCMARLVQEKIAIPRIQWIYQIACGLRYLHDECVVHGDLHGGNILVDGNLKVYITDFALAEIAEQTASAGISREATHGLTWYSAPELMEDDTQPSYASDVWSFGCLCLLIWTGEGPYSKTTRLVQLFKILLDPRCTPEDNVSPMDSFYADQPKEYNRGKVLRSKVVLPCWSRDPEERPKMVHVEEILSTEFGDLQIQ